MQDFFFVSKRNSNVPGIILPGTWASGYDRYRATRQNGGDPWYLVIEQAIEIERLRRDATLPSRMNCCYLFYRLDHAFETACSHYWANEDMVVWLAKKLIPGAKQHTGNANLFANIDGLSFANVETLASEYWNPPGPHLLPEIITESPVQLLKPLYFHPRGTGSWQQIP